MSKNRIQQLYEELKRRRVIRVATLYVIAFWPVVQVVDILTPALNLPDSIMRYLVFAFIAAFPLVVIFAWLYDLNSEGIQRDDGKPHQALFRKRTELILVSTLIVLVLSLFFVKETVEESPAEFLLEAERTDSTNKKVDKSYSSIAVLPFVTFSAEPRDQFFADGLTEELLNVLSRITDLHVAARTSSFAYKGVNKNVQIIGQELNVSTILEGSVRKNDIDNTIRVTAQLIDVANGSHLWSKSFDRQFTDIFKIQDEISAAVAERLKLTLKGKVDFAPRSLKANPEALIAYSMGQAELAKRTERGFIRAAEYFQTAIDLDSEYALAYSGFADANSLLVNYKYQSADKGLPIAREAVNKALAIDPKLGIAWASEGLLLSLEKDKKDKARQALKRAMELNPSYAMAFMWYAGLVEDPKVRLDYYQKAYSLDPKSAVAGYNIANILVQDGRDQEAMSIFGKIVEADPFYAKAYSLVGRINDKRGRSFEAVRQYERSYELQNSMPLALDIAALYGDIGYFSKADVWLNLAEVHATPHLKPKLVWARARRLASEGDGSKALPYLQEAANRPIQFQNDYYQRILAAYFMKDGGLTMSAYAASIDSSLPDMNDVGYESGIKLEAQMAAAYAYTRANEHEKANDITSLIKAHFEKLAKKQGKMGSEIWYYKAVLAAIEKDEVEVLENMQRAIDEGWRQYWRVSYEPAMNDMLSKPAFQNLLAGLETRMEIVREQFEVEAQFASGWSG